MDQLDRDRVPRGTVKRLPRVEDSQRERNRMWLCYHYGGRAWQRLRQMYVDLRQKNGNVYSRSSLLGFRATIHWHLTQDYAPEAKLRRVQGAMRVQKTFFQRSCYPDNLAWVCWACTHKCSVLRSAIKSDDFFPESASGRASFALRRPAKAKPVSSWLKLVAEVCSRCPQLCFCMWERQYRTNASYSGKLSIVYFLHPDCSGMCCFTWAAAAARSQQLLFVVLAPGLWCFTAGCHVKSPLFPQPPLKRKCAPRWEKA